MRALVQSLYLLPGGQATAAENMATDLLLLEAFPEADCARLRFYGWSRPAFTFGYAQKWAEVQAAVAPGAELIRRPTGGGLVDHRADWTYALVLPPRHPLAQAKACESYRIIHEALAEVLNKAGASCQLQVANCANCANGGARGLAVCFEKAEPFDIVRWGDGRKIAGAAQKRTRHGLLFQGSVARAVAADVPDWNKVGGIFARQLAALLDSTLKDSPDQPWPAADLTKATARFASKEWNEKR